ncbi:selenocysteine-specific translation elongation factor [Diaphorobacter ruginosibacter]|uniref:Selenocysteine-specific elongation factor n=1 Tax=Diaphorobacter ruginosibacter TaxID=1715720 RepID=A0A7G9RLK8_9BURK|nr:selenocysteine-specific translation elongation factor [Diaphorobacter ruginosibacter]QNN56483.1 selenocysteine-specific translation elongation factor [Diaphorobacter ruginosibacter]
MIIGTAGHIDHGKTSLVRALTGVETDRLPEEKRRGISIELGYAYLHTDDGTTLGFVDVPGHEKLLHTMLAGATGIAHALLVVAADDGVMPQTREHFAVVSLLGVSRATVAITKIDRLDAATRVQRLAQVRAEIAALLAPTELAGSPVFEVSATQGAGIDALREHLLAQARPHDLALPRGSDVHAFRLAVDRSFTLAGVGTVVTGSVTSGTVYLGDELTLSPSGRQVRVRGIHALNRQAESATQGQRCALALAGVAKDEVRRGEWISARSIALHASRIDVQCTLWPDEARALRSGTPVHVHLGTSDITGSIVLLDRTALEAGETALAQLVLHASVAAWHGDRGVLRDASATRTLAGIRVLDPFAPQRYRSTPERLAVLQAQAETAAANRLEGLLAHAALGLDLTRTARAEALQGPDALPLPADTLRFANDQMAIAPVAIAALKGRVLERLHHFHQASPDEIGPDIKRLKRLAAPRADDALWQYLIAQLTAEGSIARSGHWLHLPEHAVRMNAAEEQMAQQLLPRLDQGAFDPPWVRTLATDTQIPEAMVRQTLASLARRGQVFQVVKDLFYPLNTIERLAIIARTCEAADAGLQAAAFRDATGLGRKRAIQLLEFFDRVGFTRRVKDQHLLRPGTSLFE